MRIEITPSRLPLILSFCRLSSPKHPTTPHYPANMPLFNRVFYFFTQFYLLVSSSPCFEIYTGDTIQGLEHQPCINLAGVSSFCCATNRTTPYGGADMGPGKRSRDLCLPYGLCKHVTNGAIQYWRQSCTDRSSTQPECDPSLCKVYCCPFDDQLAGDC